MAFDLTMGGQFALIPAKVLYDDHIPATAKLLYGEIYRLSHANGYCYATNKDFMALLQRSENTVTDLIKALGTAGYIRVKLIRRFGATGDIVQRRIFVGQTLAPEDPEDLDGGTPENWDTYPRKLGDRPQKTVTPLIKRKIIKREYIVRPLICGRDARTSAKGTRNWRLRCLAFWKAGASGRIRCPQDGRCPSC